MVGRDAVVVCGGTVVVEFGGTGGTDVVVGFEVDDVVVVVVLEVLLEVVGVDDVVLVVEVLSKIQSCIF